MKELIIIKYGEIALKGGNRPEFENKLVSNIRSALRPKTENMSISRRSGRILIEGISPSIGSEVLGRVFGIESWSPAIMVQFSLENIKASVDRLFDEHKIRDQQEKKRFRVSTNRVDKRIAITSMETDREIGAYVADTYGLPVSLKAFELEIAIDIFEGDAYVSIEKNPGQGGLPLGIEGRVLLLADNDASKADDCIVSGLMMMKRGCEVMPVVIRTADLRKDESLKQRIMLALSQYCHGQRLEITYLENSGELSQAMGMHRAKALILPLADPPAITEAEDAGKVLRLFPLSGLTREEIDEAAKRFGL